MLRFLRKASGGIRRFVNGVSSTARSLAIKVTTPVHGLAVRLLPIAVKLVLRPASHQIEKAEKAAAESIEYAGQEEPEWKLARHLLQMENFLSSEAERPEDKFSYCVATLMRMYSLKAYNSSDHKKTRLETMSSGNLVVEAMETMFEEKSGGSSGPRGNVVDFGVTVLAFKGTSMPDEVLTDVTIKLRSNNDKDCDHQCRKVCYRHGEECNRCTRGCTTHNKYLDGRVHQGFYDLLFKETRAPKDHRYLTEGPVNALTVILEKALYNTLDHDTGRWQTSLWLTGHSLGGAMASLVLARLQTPVDKADPLVRELGEDDQQRYIGSTVLEVMTSQAIKNFPAAHACGTCEESGCNNKDWDNCTECSYCRMMRSKVRRRMDWVDRRRHCCIRLWHERMTKACLGCQDFMDGKSRKPACVHEKSKKVCFCGNCGNCVDCKKLRDCDLCNTEPKNWPVVLRGCYTFGSPRVGDDEFAKSFDENQKKSFKSMHEDKKKVDRLDERRRIADEENYRSDLYRNRSLEAMEAEKKEDNKERFRAHWPVYWRIVNEGDPVTRMPIIYYRHVGYRVQLPSSNEDRPIIKAPRTRSSTSEVDQEMTMIKGAIKGAFRPNIDFLLSPWFWAQAAFYQIIDIEAILLPWRIWSSLFMQWSSSAHGIAVYGERLAEMGKHFESYRAHNQHDKEE